MDPAVSDFLKDFAQALSSKRSYGEFEHKSILAVALLDQHKAVVCHNQH